MAKQTFEEGNLLVEAYNDGQFRFIESRTEENGDPAKDILWFNSRNFDTAARVHGGSSTSSQLETILKEKRSGTFGFVNDLNNKGVALLKKHDIDVPAKPTGYPELHELYANLESRSEIDLNDVKPGMLIAYLHPTINTLVAQMLKVGEVKPFMENKIIVEAEPTSFSDTYLKFSVSPKASGWANVIEYSQIGDSSTTITMERELPKGKTRIVAITEDDMKKIKDLVPEDPDLSLERVHYKIMDTDLASLIASDTTIKEKVTIVTKFVKYSMKEYPGEENYRQACEFLVDNRDKLVQDVNICLPGGLCGNRDPVWTKVKKNSESRCNCGNERIIRPKFLEEKRDYVPSDSGSVVVSPGNEFYFKTVGGDQESTYVKLYIPDSKKAIAFMQQPFGSINLNSLMGDPAFNLEKLAASLSESKKPEILRFGDKENAIPILAINSIDLDKMEVTVTPDETMEAYQLNES
jgi:hypothetical protein